MTSFIANTIQHIIHPHAHSQTSSGESAPAPPAASSAVETSTTPPSTTVEEQLVEATQNLDVKDTVSAPPVPVEELKVKAPIVEETPAVEQTSSAVHIVEVPVSDTIGETTPEVAPAPVVETETVPEAPKEEPVVVAAEPVLGSTDFASQSAVEETKVAEELRVEETPAEIEAVAETSAAAEETEIAKESEVAATVEEPVKEADAETFPEVEAPKVEETPTEVVATESAATGTSTSEPDVAAESKEAEIVPPAAEETQTTVELPVEEKSTTPAIWETVEEVIGAVPSHADPEAAVPAPVEDAVVSEAPAVAMDAPVTDETAPVSQEIVVDEAPKVAEE